MSAHFQMVYESYISIWVSSSTYVSICNFTYDTDLIKLAVKATYIFLLIFQLHYLLTNISFLKVHDVFLFHGFK